MDDVYEPYRDDVKRNLEAISDSRIFMVVFNEKMSDEPAPVIQMGLAVYLDKPIYLIVPKSKEHLLNINIRRLARGIEIFDDTQGKDEEILSLHQATVRLSGLFTRDEGENEHA